MKAWEMCIACGMQPVASAWVPYCRACLAIMPHPVQKKEETKR